MIKADKIKRYVHAGDLRQTEAHINEALKNNMDPAIILNRGLVAGVAEAVEKFYRKEIFAPDLLIVERAMKAGMKILLPLINQGPNAVQGTVVTGTPEGDIQDSGRIILLSLLESMGLKVINLGTSVRTPIFIRTAVEENAQIIICTTSMVSFLPRMRTLVQAAGLANIRRRTKILIAGRPVTASFSKNVDADMYAPDMKGAAEMAADYCRKHRKVS